MGRYKRTTCSKCGNPIEENRLGNHGYCKACAYEYTKKNALIYVRTPEQIARQNVRTKTNLFIKRHLIPRQSCFVCGQLKAEVHHTDYTKPYEIVFLCRKHHQDHHTNKLEVDLSKGIVDLKKMVVKVTRPKYGRRTTCAKCNEPLTENLLKAKISRCLKCRNELRKLKNEERKKQGLSTH